MQQRRAQLSADFYASTMNKQRAYRMSSALDSSFQIPLSVNSAANDLLLEDDALKDDFFDGLDYTLTTPIPTRTQLSGSPQIGTDTGRKHVESERSEQENFDYNYLREERELELGIMDVDDETPRGTRIGGSALLGSPSTPRSHRYGSGSRDSNSVSRLPTLGSRTPVLTKLQGQGEQSSPAKEQLCNSLSPSVTPKPKQKRTSKYRTPPSVHSSPAGALMPSSVSRPSEAELREINMSRHEHARATHSSPALSSVSALSNLSGQYTSASVGELTRNPQSPEKVIKTSRSPSRAKHPAMPQRRQSRSRIGGRSPLHLTRFGHDAVMLPIQEEEEDLRARDERSSISNQAIGFAAPRGKLINDEDEELAEKGGNCAEACEDQSKPLHPQQSPIRVTVPKPKVTLSRRPLGKRSSDGLASQPALKKRKTDLTVTHAEVDVDSVKGSLQPPAVHPGLADIAYTALNESPAGEAETDITTANTLPVTPDSNFRTASPPPSIKFRSDAPLGGTNMAQTLHESHESRDEVQDFLSRYAKKYGAVSSGTSKGSTADPKKSITLGKDRNEPQVLAPPDCWDVNPEHNRPKVKHVSLKIKQSLKSGSKHVAQQAGVRATLNKRDQVSKPRSALPIRDSEDGPSIKACTETDADPEAAPSAPRVVDNHGLLKEPPQRLIFQETANLPADSNSAADASPRRILELSGQPSPVVIPAADIAQTDGPQVLEAASAALGSSRVSEVTKIDTASPVPKASAVFPTPSASTDKVTGTSMNLHSHRSVHGEPSKRPPATSAPQTTKRKLNPEPHADDMFARKKRDNYLRKGIDLSAHSSRRRCLKPPVASVQNEHSRALVKEKLRLNGQNNTGLAGNNPECLDHAEAVVAGPSRSVTADLELSSDAEYQGRKQSAPLDVQLRDHQRASVDLDSISLDKEGSGSTSSVAERLAHFGQKIVNSFGLLSSQSNADATVHDTAILPDPEHGRRDSKRARGSQSREGPNGYRESLSPRKNESKGGDRDFPIVASGIDCVQTTGWHQQEGAGVDCRADQARVPECFHAILDKHTETQRDSGTSLPSSRLSKQAMRGESEDTVRKDNGDIQQTTAERAQKRIRLTREGDFAGGAGASSKTLDSEKSRSKKAEKGSAARGGTRGLAVNRKTKETGTSSTTLNAEAYTRQGGPKNTCCLTIPVAPVFTTDSLLQQRVLARTERESQLREKSDEMRSNVSKPDDRTAGKRAKTRVLTSDTQTREPWKPTVPHAFRFETDTRRSNRKQDFRAKLVAWEQRATSESKLGGRTAPDKNLHAAQANLASMAARRRELLAPTVPISPHFVVETRLADRRRFEETRREKEKEAERIMEEQRRAREEEEEREWREARKRTVPRANQIPEWYSQAPKRTVPGR